MPQTLHTYMQRITQRDGIDYLAKLKSLRGGGMPAPRAPQKEEAPSPNFISNLKSHKKKVAGVCAAAAAAVALWWYKRRSRSKRKYPTAFMQAPPGAPAPLPQTTGRKEDLTKVTELRDEMAQARSAVPGAQPVAASPVAGNRSKKWIHILVCVALLGGSGLMYFKFGRKQNN
jgi:hypothetical protein